MKSLQRGETREEEATREKSRGDKVKKQERREQVETIRGVGKRREVEEV